MCQPNATARALRILHYDTKWLDWKFLDERVLHQQLAEYENGKDQNTEHYRFAAFKELLDKATSPLHDSFIDRYMELASIDKDPQVSHSALLLLAKFPGLTDDQLDRIAKSEPFAEAGLRRVIKRTHLMRKLNSAALGEELFTQCLSLGMPEIEKKLLERKDLTKEQIEDLMMHGSNKGIRNAARNLLRKWIPR
jgi:hypothetical protein